MFGGAIALKNGGGLKLECRGPLQLELRIVGTVGGLLFKTLSGSSIRRKIKQLDQPNPLPTVIRIAA